MISITNYMPNESPYAVCVDIGPWLRVWFSYGIPVAFCTPGTTPVVSANIWTRTTARHIAQIRRDWPDAQSVPYEEFADRFAKVIVRFGTALKHMDDIELMRRLEDAAKEER